MKEEELEKRLERIEKLLVAQQPRPLTLPEAASYLGISKSRLYALISRSLIPYYKPTKRVYFLKGDLDNYLLRNRSTALDEVAGDIGKKHLTGDRD